MARSGIFFAWFSRNEQLHRLEKQYVGHHSAFG
jgi:hypothetical protein